MNIIINKGVLERFVKSRLREERSFHTKDISEIPAKEDEEPIVPIEQMAVQLSVEEPPVGDPEFIPSSIVELANSASVIARETPSHQIEFFYRELHKLLDRALDRENDRIRGDHQKQSGVVLPDQDLEGVEIEEERVVRESIRRFLLEQDEESFSPDEQDNIEVAYQGIKEYLDSIRFGYTSKPRVAGGVSNTPYTPDLIRLELRQRMGPDNFDPRISQLLDTLSPEGVRNVRSRIIDHYSKLSRKMPSHEEVAQLKANKIADMKSGELEDGGMSKDDIATELVRASELPVLSYTDPRSGPVDVNVDQFIINALQNAAREILSGFSSRDWARQHAAAEEILDRWADEGLLQDTGEQAASDVEKEEFIPEVPSEDCNSLCTTWLNASQWTRIAEEEGFASAAGARQYGFKPLMKTFLSIQVIPPAVIGEIIFTAYKKLKRELRDPKTIQRLRDDGVDVPARSLGRESPQFRTFLKTIFWQPFINEFLKRWKAQAGIILTNMDIDIDDSSKKMFAKMLIGETSPSSKSAKAKINKEMVSPTAAANVNWSKALQASRDWAGNPDNTVSLARAYADRLKQPGKIYPSIKKALSNPEI